MTILLSVVAMASVAQAEEAKLGYVNVQYVMTKSPQRVAITEKLKSEFKEQEEAIKGLVGDYQKLQEKFKKDGTTMSEQERIDLNRKGQELETQIKLKQNALQEDMQRRSQDEQRVLAQSIMKEVAAFAEKNGYKMIVNSDALLWADPSLDVSDQILAKLGAAGN